MGRDVLIGEVFAKTRRLLVFAAGSLFLSITNAEIVYAGDFQRAERLAEEAATKYAIIGGCCVVVFVVFMVLWRRRREKQARQLEQEIEKWKDNLDAGSPEQGDRK